ncbi:MAG: scaffolding protein [Plesiomonas sp.]
MSDNDLTMQQNLDANGQGQANPEQNQANANANDAPEEFEIVVADATQGQQKQDPATNRAFAAERIARKRQKELEQQVEQLKQGQISDDMRVKPDLPDMPKPEDFLSDVALEKYGYDQNVAMAAFQQANTEWQLKAMDARSVAQAKQSQRVSQFINQAGEHTAKVRQHYDTAEKLGITKFDEIEERITHALPQGWANDIIGLFPDKSAAIFAHLDANPDKLARFASMNPSYATVELTRLADSLTIKKKGAISKAPPPEEILSASGGAGNAELMKQLEKAAKDGNVALYRQLKAKL